MTGDIVKAILKGKNTPMVLATIIERKGSAPRDIGAKMLVMGDGTIVGTVGGGALEAKVVERSRHVAETGVPEILSFNMTSQDAEKAGMICGGTARVFLERI
ncbi:MAG: hypothetical protein PWQ96_1250 [Clostridia bacterium]|jgi:xanthine dehydrogenase accessory factor|nr:sulfurylase small subunit, molybdopterin cytosine dinucleotide biosynthesis [Clostridiales bacterium]MDK2985608.1 hypothetical protein [Clostridia bacterium]